MKLVPSLLAGALLVGLTGSAFAGEASSTIPVTATVIPACAITAANMQFAAVGNISPESGFAGETTQAVLALTCNDTSLSATVELDKQPMLNSTDGVTAISYNLFQDAALSLPWGTTADNTAMTLVSAYGANPLTVYGQIPAQPNVVAGVYSAPITATVSF